MKTILTSALLAGVGLLAAGGASAADGNTLKAVKARGTLNCPGHNGSYLGFAELDDKGNWKGLDIDLCRGIAAAVFDDATKVKIVPISWEQRWPALQSGDIDVVIKAYQLYLEQTQTQGLEALLSVTRAWRLVKFIDNGMLTMTKCSKCGGHFVTHPHEIAKHYVCGMCNPPARAGKGKLAGALQIPSDRAFAAGVAHAH